MSRQQFEDFVNVSEITLNVNRQFSGAIYRIGFEGEAASGHFEKKIYVEVAPGQKHEELFNPPQKLSTLGNLSVVVKYYWPWPFRRKHVINVDLKEAATEAKDSGNAGRVYSKFDNNINVVIGISGSKTVTSGSTDQPPLITTHEDDPLPDADHSSDHLVSTTSEILSKCPRFRLLIIGNSGVGKSTLVQKVFGVKEVQVSDSVRGAADIDQEFVASDNSLFVVHDSLGLEAGESHHFNIVKRFIAERRAKKDLKDRLHAVWVCITVPYSDGRLLEAGIEDLLKNRKTILGDIPVVVVLTKLDLLDASLMQKLSRQGVKFKTIEEAQNAIQPDRSAFLGENCFKPLERALGDDIPHIVVSTIKDRGRDYMHTIPDLVKVTASQIEQYINAHPSVPTASPQRGLERNGPLLVAGMAQRVSMEEKVQVTIQNLAAGLASSDEPIKNRLRLLHRDIIQAWNFYDPNQSLGEKNPQWQNQTLQEALFNTSYLNTTEEIRNARAPLVCPKLQVPTTLESLLLEPIGNIIVPMIQGINYLTKLGPVVYDTLPLIAKCFMAYIVDLVYVMKILFILTPHGPITTRDVTSAFEHYKESDHRKAMHKEIDDFQIDGVVLGRDTVLEKVEELINRFNVTDQEVHRIRAKILA